MGLFPKIDSPCPYKADLAAVMDGEFCRMCKRDVVDLDAMDDAGRVAFLSACEGAVCVRYSMPVRPALAAAALAMAAMATPAMAQEVPVDAAAVAPIEEFDDIFVGGIADPRRAEYVDTAQVDADAALTELPVVYEDAQPAAEAAVTPAT